MNTRIRFRIKREKRVYRSFLRRWYTYLICFADPFPTIGDFAKYEEIKVNNKKLLNSNLKLIKEGF